MKRVKRLNAAILELNYLKVEEALQDPQTPVNLGGDNVEYSAVKLPLKVVFEKRDAQMAQLFLNCPRVDWLAPTWNRSLFELESVCGLQYEFDSIGDLYRNKLDYFYYLDEEFLRGCPAEASIIYERMIDELVKSANVDNYDRLLFNTCNDLIAFQYALAKSANINARDENGKSLLHHTKSLSVVKLLMERDADLNTLDDNEWSPLMAQANAERWEIVEFLIQSGADTQFINSKHESCLSVCLQPCKFISYSDVSEELFRNELIHGSTLTARCLEILLKTHPKYREIFESDIPLHLAALTRDFKSSKYYDDLNDIEYVSFLKNLIRRTDDIDWRKPRRKPFDDHANEFLHVAAESNRPNCILNLFRAKVNSIINGKTALFRAKYDAMVELLKTRNIDTIIECDGFKFFERVDFCLNVKEISASWLIDLYKKGYDLLGPAEKTKKSLVQYLPHEAKLKVRLSFSSGSADYFYFPVSRLSKRFFEVLGTASPDLCSPIDDQDNSICHYYVPRAESFKFLASKLLFESTAELKLTQNKDGISIFQLLSEHDRHGIFGLSILRTDDFKCYLEYFYAFNGVDACELFGGRFVLKEFSFNDDRASPDWNIVNYLVNEKGISFNRLIIKRDNFSGPASANHLGHLILEQSMKRKLYDNINSKLVDYGYRHCFADYEMILSCGKADDIVRIVEVADNEEIKQIIEHIAIKYKGDSTSFSGTAIAVLSHRKVLQATAQGCLNDCTILDQYLFSLCYYNSIERLNFFFRLGLDPRRLIGSGLKCILGPNCRSLVSSRDDISQILTKLQTAGWAAKDFKNILIESNFQDNLLDFLLSNHNIHDAFVVIFEESIFEVMQSVFAYRKLNPNQVIGTTTNCAICREEFDGADTVWLLNCKHIFHLDCSKDYIKQNKHCPYCRTEALIRIS